MKNLLMLVLVALVSLSSCKRGVENTISKDSASIKKEVKKYLKSRLPNPRSYKDIAWTITPQNNKETGKPEAYIVKHEYKAKDAMTGTERNEASCFIYDKPTGTLHNDDACRGYKRIYDAIIGKMEGEIKE